MDERKGKIKLLSTGDYPITVLDAVKLGDGTKSTLRDYLKSINNASETTIVNSNGDNVLELKNLNMINNLSYTFDSRGWATFEKVEVTPGKKYKFYFLSNWSYFEDEDGNTLSTNDHAEPVGSMSGYITVPQGYKYLIAKVAEQNAKNVYLSEFEYSFSLNHNVYLAGLSEDKYRESLKNDILYGHLYGKTLYCIGDSTTQGTYNYHRKIADELYMSNASVGFGGSRYSCGVGTNESSNIIYNELDIEKIKNSEIITVMAGCNDISNSTPIGDFEDRTLETFYGSMHLTFQKILQNNPNARIGVITPFPKGTITGKGMWEKCKEYNEVIKDVAGYYQIPVFDALKESGMAVDIGLNGIAPTSYAICESTDSEALEVVTTVVDSVTQIAYDDVISITDLSDTLKVDNSQYVKVTGRLMYNGMLYDGTHGSTIGIQIFAGHLFDFIANLKTWNKML